MLTIQTDSICTLPELLVAMLLNVCVVATGRWVKEVVWVVDHANRFFFSSMFVELGYCGPCIAHKRNVLPLFYDNVNSL